MDSNFEIIIIQVPTLILGPFGCGKTEALSSCAKFLSLHDPNAKILICTHNNSAADIYVKAIHTEFLSEKNEAFVIVYACVYMCTPTLV